MSLFCNVFDPSGKCWENAGKDDLFPFTCVQQTCERGVVVCPHEADASQMWVWIAVGAMVALMGVAAGVGACRGKPPPDPEDDELSLEMKVLEIHLRAAWFGKEPPDASPEQMREALRRRDDNKLRRVMKSTTVVWSRKALWLVSVGTTVLTVVTLAAQTRRNRDRFVHFWPVYLATVQGWVAWGTISLLSLAQGYVEAFRCNWLPTPIRLMFTVMFKLADLAGLGMLAAVTTSCQAGPALARMINVVLLLQTVGVVPLVLVAILNTVVQCFCDCLGVCFRCSGASERSCCVRLFQVVYVLYLLAVVLPSFLFALAYYFVSVVAGAWIMGQNTWYTILAAPVTSASLLFVLLDVLSFLA